jgi:phosphate-selective porin OprO/OprP
MRYPAVSFLMLVLPLAAYPQSAAQESGLRPGQGVTFRNEDGSATLNIGGRIQARHTYEENSDSSSFSIPRLRLGLKGSVYSAWKWEVQADFAKKEKVTLKDGFVDRALAADDAVNLRFGQFKTAFDRQQLESSGRQTFADRNIASDFLGKARDIGLQVHGKAMNRVLQYNAGVFNGAGEGNPSASGGHMAVARISVNPLGDFGLSQGDIKPSPAPRFFVDAAAYHNQDSSLGSLDGTTGLAVGAGIRYAGAYAAGEYLRRVPQAGGDADGFYAQASYMILPGLLEAAVRHAQVDPNTDVGGNRRTETTAAANVFFNQAGHNLKLTGDLSLLTDEAKAGDDKNNIRSRVQFQLVF